MLYYLFMEHHITPVAYYGMDEGEKTVLRAFFEHDMEERKKWQSDRSF